ncbi:hypothetical protein pipiens_010518 [Culex pipiens pipiens]|uniref:Uncharacterized protein n=1 Tax=Culex pipiens pipiens TaxID=38569 RepID=A0ABD1D9U6_CULPP
MLNDIAFLVFFQARAAENFKRSLDFNASTMDESKNLASVPDPDAKVVGRLRIFDDVTDPGLPNRLPFQKPLSSPEVYLVRTG